MKASTAPRKKQVSRGIGIVIIIIAAVVIVLVAYMATRPGGFSGQDTLSEKMMKRAKQAGVSSPRELFEQQGKRRGGSGEGAAGGGQQEQPAGE
jgi:flagellar basal body-associated protein FliL